MLGFLQNDAAAMKQQVAFNAGKPGVEDLFLEVEASTAAYSGQLGKAREFDRRATASAERADEKESAASYEANAAVREALFGNASEARQRAASALGLSMGRDVQYGVALAHALIEDSARAQALADDLDKRFPEDTVVWFNYLPALRGQIALNRNDVPKSLEFLQAATPYELGGYAGLYPAYVRGEASSSRESVGAKPPPSSKKSSTIAASSRMTPSAHSRISKSAEPMRCKETTPRRGRRTRISSPAWKDADPDIPILIAAKSEFAKLK